MGELRFKRLMVENWQEPDPVVSSFVYLPRRDGSIQPLSGDAWARGILTVELSERVPLEVRRLFAVARGALVYGYFFYPLYTLGAEQLVRVAEAAIGYKCSEVGVSEIRLKNLNFKDRIAYLVKHGVIPRSDQDRWDALRQLRNLASHPDDQLIFSPGIAIGALQRITADIDGLFGVGR